MATPTTTSDSAPPTVVSIESLLGKTLLGKDDKIIATNKALEKKDFVLLYFSASWCPPCRAFSPVLKEFYKNVKDSVEIVYISSDKDYTEFSGYFGTMPWLSLPEKNPSNNNNNNNNNNNKSTDTTASSVVEIKNYLAKMCQVRGIPTLIVLERKTGMFVTDQARTQIQQVIGSNPVPAQALACRELVHKTWKVETKKVPLSEAQFGVTSNGGGAGGGILSLLLSLVFKFFKNPINIFAMLYFFKLFMRKYMTTTTPGETSAAGAGDDEKEL
jgi:nucleoredoxin